MTTWRIGIVKDTSNPMLGLHGLHVAFRGLPGVEIAALADANPDSLDQKLAVTGAQRHYTSPAAMLEAEPLDIVVLCSRHPGDHLGQIEAAARRGVHVYCEKPLSASLSEADRIVELAETHRIKICMAHPARHAPAFRTMKAMIDEGAIGAPLTAYGRGKCDHRGGGEDLIVLGTHILDYMVHLFGPPQWAWADVTAEGKPIERTDRGETVEPIGPAAGDSLLAAFGFGGGVRGVFQSGRGLFDRQSGHIYMGITVHGTSGTLSMRFNDSYDPVPLRISGEPAPPEDHTQYEEIPVDPPQPVPGAEPLDYALCGTRDIPGEPFFLEANRSAAWDLIGSIEQDRLPISNVYDARRTVEMICGVYASHLQSRRVTFPLADRHHPLGED